MFKIGLKLWSTNRNYVDEAVRLHREGFYDYIELFVVPNSFQAFSSIWKSLNIPYIIHAPHSAKGLNLAKKEMLNKNLILADEAKAFANLLNVDTIIFHPGIDGDINQTVLQLNNINDLRIVVENKPYYGLLDELCVGNSPEEISFIIKETGVKFCLDVGHAICSANAQRKNSFSYLQEFVKLEPKICHVSDGDIDTIYDQHKNLGKGNFNLKDILKILNKDLMISLETRKNFDFSLKDFEEDVIFFQSLIG